MKKVFAEEDVQKAMREIKKKHHIPENQTNFFIDPSLYNPMTNLEKQAVYRLRGRKGKKKSTDDSVTTQTSDISSLTAKVDQLTNSVAKISQIVGKRQTRDKGTNYNSDDDDMFASEDDTQSVRSSASRKSGNRDHDALSAHPSPARQDKI